MAIRSLALLSFVATAFCFAPSAHADVPNPTTGSGTTTTTTSTTTTGAGGSTGTGTGTTTNNPDCTVSAQSIAGSTCQTCTHPAGGSCSGLDSEYNFACDASSTVAVWCNGPARTSSSDQNVGCAVAVPGGSWSGLAAAGLLAAAAVLSLRRRRRI